MPRVRTHYVCSVCGYTAPRWVGRCPECGEWNTLQEETQNIVKHAPKRGGGMQVVAPARAYAVEDLPDDTETRLPTGIAEFDRVLGGGVVAGSLTLIGGEPGIGKSTLMLQVANALAKHGTVLYITGEESLRQVRMRALRLHATHPNLKVATGAELEPILSLLNAEQPLCAIVDSIQTLYSPELEGIAGTVSQIRTCAGALQRLAKEHEIALFLIGHVTKEGALAGPKVLEHLVDTVLYFEGDPQGLFRILRATKNRFGATDEIGVFDMRPEGLVAVPNPSERLLAERAEGAPGSVVFPALEGSRALLMEIQALTTPSFLNNPRRVITGLTYERVSLVLAVMEKRLGFRMIQHDVFVNVAGGMRVLEPAADLAILVAVASAMRNQPVRPDLVLFGEVGLGGEVRGVPHMEARLQEAARLGFRYALVPQSNLQRPHERLPLSTLPVRTAQQAIRMALQTQPQDEEPEEDDSPFR